MFSNLCSVALVLAGLACLPTPSQADPFDPEGAVEPNYDSAFDGYVLDTEPSMSGWQQANERVGAIGGWRSYLREVQPASGNDLPRSPAGGSSVSGADIGATGATRAGTQPSVPTR